MDVALEHPEACHYLEFANRFPRNERQPCIWHHLEAGCPKEDTYQYDHSALNDKEHRFMQFKAKLIPCADGTQCRRSVCPFGHVCQSKKCVGKDIKDCPLKAFHQIDPVVARWVESSEAQRSITFGKMYTG